MNRVKTGDMIFYIFLYALMVIAGLITLYPFVNVLAISFNDATDAVKGGIYIWPRVFTLQNYKEVFNYPELTTAAFISVLRTVAGVITAVFSCSMLAYVFSRKDFSARKIFTVLFLITMYIDSGMVPSYLLIKNLHLMNNFLVYILPGLVSAFYVLILRTYITSLGDSLQESAQIDGANDLVIFFRIIFPLCTPVVATVALYIAVDQWNAWFDTYLYAGSNKKLVTLQYQLMRILTNTMMTSSKDVVASGRGNVPKVSPESIRMTVSIIATVPILVVYPFLQKYFIKGVMIGAIKG